ncbi:hypothetical protein SAMN05444008_103304 [Cnuella takakiae]|uniref:Uncharacterized protein n=1 Tax=Cnuella takakiae TaxID=1302690 RepID=A0A1M4XAM3_9BACT|nr:hypothetical protein [Cnuella takakiae]OLY91482.1 hypothetical protein BUE76_05885 [Cnuella takakiae]SHE90493.1 hypothetical protein SAMN05444008_103304 [Cnuella takakiae]
MKTPNYILVLLLVSGCIETPDKKSEKDSHAIPQVETYTDTTPTTSSRHNDVGFTSKQYGEEIISGKVKPTDNEQTFAWLDSLQSENPNTRNFAFRVYKAMVVKSDGALSEAICGYIKDYFSSHPKEFLDNYKTLDNQEKASTQESIAFEFYASGTDYQKDLNEYFRSIKTRCNICTEADMSILEDMRSTLEAKVGQMVE